MKLGRKIERREDDKIVKRYMKNIVSNSHEIYFDKRNYCNCFFITEGIDEYLKNKYVKEQVNAKLTEIRAWIFVTRIKLKKERALKVCWTPETNKKFLAIPAYLSYTNKREYDWLCINGVINRLNTRDRVKTYLEFSDFTIKQLKKRGYRVLTHDDLTAPLGWYTTITLK